MSVKLFILFKICFWEKTRRNKYCNGTTTIIMRGDQPQANDLTLAAAELL
jgi:hypothetical protein